MIKMCVHKIHLEQRLHEYRLWEQGGFSSREKSRSMFEALSRKEGLNVMSIVPKGRAQTRQMVETLG